MSASDAIRIVTWNAHAKNVRSRWELIEGFDANVLSIQEGGPSTKSFVESHDGWTCEWQEGRYPDQGVAVLAKEPFRIEGGVEFSRPCVLSTLIKGPQRLRFRFVGFWGMSPINKSVDDYPLQAKEMIDLLPRDELPTVVAGDFNASSRSAQHVENVASLGARRMKSAYDDFYGAPDTYPGDHPTSYHKWNEGLPHHMDYVFLPSHWIVQDVRVGTYAEYSATKRSDHMPVTVVTFPN